MFEFYFRPGKWPEFGIKQESDFKKIYVTDFATTKAINAKGAFFVYGSDTTSPAGDDLVPFDSYKAAEEFSKAHNGKRIFGFREVSRGLINWLNDSL
jgi:nitrous oxide reductase accessory protein NosL